MRMERIGLVFIIIFFSNHLCGFGQDRLSVSTRQIDQLINEWNFANNQRSLESFENIYASELLFYTHHIDKRNAIEKKQQLFLKSPDFQQRMVTLPTYTPYTSGVMKCAFVKEVVQDKRTRRYNAYLLVSYENGKFVITGESDEETDGKLGYTPDLGDTIELNSKVDSIRDDSVMIISASTSSHESRRFDSPIVDLNSALTYITAKDPTTIRRDHIFVLVGLLLGGGILIVVSDSLQARSSRRKTRAKNKGKGHEFEMYRLQTDFQKFVITLFDPLYFRHRRIHPPHQAEEAIAPLLAVDFENKQSHAKFAVQTVYLPEGSLSDINLFSRTKLSQLYHYQKTHALDVYVIVGAGGQPDDPQEVFLLPANMLHERITYETLKPHRKYGMFFYHSDGQRLV
jgi:hypothetical protein